MLLPTINFDNSLFFKSTVAFKGSMKHDISFRRRVVQRKKFAKFNRIIVPTLLDFKTNRFFKKRVLFRPDAGSTRVFNRAKYGRGSFNLRFLPVKPSAFAKQRSRSFSFFTTHKFFRNSAKKPIRQKAFSTYAKRWQIFFTRSHLKAFRPWGLKVYNNMRQYFRQQEPSASRLKKNTENFDSVSYGAPCILDFLQAFWPGASFGFFLHLLSSHTCSVNNQFVTSLLYPVTPGAIIRFNIPPLSFIMFSLIGFRFIKGSLGFKGFVSKIKRFLPSGAVEANFKTLEFLVLSTYPLAFSLQPYFSYRFNRKLMLYERFFSKQKKFGLGRLL